MVGFSGALADRRAPQPVADAVSALINLGYPQAQAAAAVAAAGAQGGRGRRYPKADQSRAEGACEVSDRGLLLTGRDKLS